MFFFSYQIQNLGFVFLKYSFCLPNDNEILNGHDMIRYNTLEEFLELIFCFCFFFLNVLCGTCKIFISNSRFSLAKSWRSFEKVLITVLMRF